MFKRSLASACVLIPTIALLVLAAPAPAARAASPADPITGPTIIPSLHNDVSVALTAMADIGDKEKKEKKVKPHREIPGHAHGGSSAAQPVAPAVAIATAGAPRLLRRDRKRLQRTERDVQRQLRAARHQRRGRS